MTSTVKAEAKMRAKDCKVVFSQVPALNPTSDQISVQQISQSHLKEGGIEYNVIRYKVEYNTLFTDQYVGSAYSPKPSMKLNGTLPAGVAANHIQVVKKANTDANVITISLRYTHAALDVCRTTKKSPTLDISVAMWDARHGKYVTSSIAAANQKYKKGKTRDLDKAAATNISELSIMPPLPGEWVADASKSEDEDDSDTDSPAKLSGSSSSSSSSSGSSSGSSSDSDSSGSNSTPPPKSAKPIHTNSVPNPNSGASDMHTALLFSAYRASKLRDVASQLARIRSCQVAVAYQGRSLPWTAAIGWLLLLSGSDQS